MSEVSLGRVQPLYKGVYTANTSYSRLDTVYYESDGGSWVCIKDAQAGIYPSNNGFWQQIARRGDQGIQGLTGDFGTPIVTTQTLVAGSDASVAISVDSSSPATEKRFQFDFSIPAGPVGYDDVAAHASSLPAGTAPSATANLITNASGSIIMDFTFGIPVADGAGAQAVDGQTPVYNPITGLQEISLYAVSYNSSQTLNDGQKIIARTNINAQKAGDYLVSTGDKMTGDLLVYSSDLYDGQQVGYDQDGVKLSFVSADASSTTNFPELAYVIPQFKSSGTQGLLIGTTREIEGYSYNNEVFLAIDSTGNKSIQLSNADAEAWRKGIGVVPAANVTPAQDTTNGNTGESGAYARADHAHKVNFSPVQDAPRADAASASMGSSIYYAHNDHIHKWNVSDQVQDVKPDGATASLGSIEHYAIVDHIHPLNVNDNTNNILSDAVTASVGTLDTYARTNHRHPLNVDDNTLPKELGAQASSGNAAVYARRDHIHPLPNPLAIEYGGTGAKTLNNARINLNVAAAPTTITVNLSGGNWNQSTTQASVGVDYWYQNNITISGGTAKSIIDLQPDILILSKMVNDGVAAIYIKNDGGSFTAYAVDGCPQTTYAIPAIRTELP